MIEKLGAFFGSLRERSGLFRNLMFAALALLVVLNIFIHPHHPHVDAEHYPGFWAVFGLGVGVVLIYLVKCIISELVAVSEDYYESDN